MLPSERSSDQQKVTSGCEEPVARRSLEKIAERMPHFGKRLARRRAGESSTKTKRIPYATIEPCKAFIRDETGATAIEYAMIAAFVFLAIVAAVPLLGRAVSDKFNFVTNSFPS